VISSPAHMREWWGGVNTDLEPAAGAAGELVWGDPAGAESQTTTITVVEAVPPRRFSFRWTHPSGEAAADGNSLLVTFDLAPSGSGTVLRLTETGFREMGWETAVLEATYLDHSSGWGRFVPAIAEYAARLASTP
jgi:uncharacterized protein YndB with AHSA1/START domain